MVRKIFMTLIMIFPCIHGMDTVSRATGSACIVGGIALVVQGMQKHTVFGVERLRAHNNHHVCYRPLQIDDWLREVAAPVVVGSTLCFVGLVLGWK